MPLVPTTQTYDHYKRLIYCSSLWAKCSYWGVVQLVSSSLHAKKYKNKIFMYHCERSIWQVLGGVQLRFTEFLDSPDFCPTLVINDAAAPSSRYRCSHYFLCLIFLSPCYRLARRLFVFKFCIFISWCPLIVVADSFSIKISKLYLTYDMCTKITNYDSQHMFIGIVHYTLKCARLHI